MNKSKRRRQWKQDQHTLLKGVNLGSTQAEPTEAMARQLFSMLEQAKRDGRVDAPVKFLQSKVNASLTSLGDLTLACKKGCSHCCYVWVSATAPEVLFISKVVKRMGKATIERVRDAHERTKEFDFDTRYLHPQACPLLEDDLCQIYDSRPNACRFAASGSAEICARAYHNLSDEAIPIPTTHLKGSSIYSLAMAAALRKADLAYHAYEFSAALIRAIDTENAERAWLSGEGVFSGVMREPADIFTEPRAQQIYEHAFR